MELKITEKIKQNVREGVNFFETDGNGKFTFDKYCVALISLPEHNNTRIRIDVVPDTIFDEWTANPMAFATAIHKSNPILQTKLEEHLIWIKKNLFLQINQEEFDAVIQHEINHIIMGHFEDNPYDEKLCRLMNLENEHILNKISAKLLNGEYDLF